MDKNVLFFLVENKVFHSIISHTPTLSKPTSPQSAANLVPVVQKLDSAIHRIDHYPVDIIINIRGANCAIHRIDHYPVDNIINIRGANCAIQWIEIYPLDSAIHLLKNWSLVVRARLKARTARLRDHTDHRPPCSNKWQWRVSLTGHLGNYRWNISLSIQYVCRFVQVYVHV